MIRIRETLPRAAAAALLLFTLAASGRAADATLLKGELDGKELSAAIAKQKGHVVLVNFWATWCVPCREEFPDFVRLEKAWRDRGLRVIGVSTDLAKDLPKVEKFLAAANPGFAQTNTSPANPNAIEVRTRNEKGDSEDADFHLIVVCP